MKSNRFQLWQLAGFALFLTFPPTNHAATNKLRTPATGKDNLAALARAGNVDAQIKIASQSYFGIGCETNYEDALYWFRLAAEKGSPKAQYRLGYMLYKGLGSETNLAEADEWLKKAEAQGDTDAIALAARVETLLKKLEAEEQSRAAELHRLMAVQEAATAEQIANVGEVQNSTHEPDNRRIEKTPVRLSQPDVGKQESQSASPANDQPFSWNFIWWIIGAFFLLRVFLRSGSKKVKPTVEVTFSSTSPRQFQPPPVSRGSPLEWMGPGTSLQVRGVTIPDPLTYTSKKSPSTGEASCIDQSLSIGTPVAEPKGALGYWPWFASISPNQRATYLRWLAGGRKAEIEDVGYVFLFFYGLERRALVENQDIELVLNEANRLLHRYSESRSFLGYCSNFIAFLLARIGVENLPKEAFEAVFRDSLKKFTEDTLSVGLAWLYKAREPLPSYLAYEVARSDIRASSSVVIRRVPDQFKTLFAKKYEQQFDKGIMLDAAARERLLEYKPSSPSLLSWNAVHFERSVRIPNVMGIPSQFKPLVSIWEACIEELRPLSREVGKGKDVFTREAYSALPDELKGEVDHPDKNKWDQFVAAHTEDNTFSLVSAGALAQLCDIQERPRMTLTQSVSVAQTASDVGYVVVPDPRVTGKPFKWYDWTAVFRPEGRILPSTDKQYKAVSLLLEMGMAIAAADGKIEHDEMAHISNFLKSQFMLEPDDTRRLEAYRAILAKQPPNLSGIAKRLRSSLDAVQMEKIGQFLVGIAAADGTLQREERSTLRKVYTAMGIELGKLDELITRLCGSPTEPVEIESREAVSRTGEPLPNRTAVIIDDSVVRSILQETEAVAHLLSSVLADHGEEENDKAAALVAPGRPESTTPAASPTEEGDARFDGLDPRYHSILRDILASDQWSKVEFNDLARKHGLMPAAVCEIINSWSDDALGDFLIEDEDPYLVHRKLMENA